MLDSLHDSVANINCDGADRRDAEGGRSALMSCGMAQRCSSLCMALVHERRMSWASLEGPPGLELRECLESLQFRDIFSGFSRSRVRQTCNIIRNATLLYSLAAPFRCCFVMRAGVLSRLQSIRGFCWSLFIFSSLSAPKRAGAEWKYHYILITNRIYVHFYLIFFSRAIIWNLSFRFNSARLVAFRGRLGLSSFVDGLAGL